MGQLLEAKGTETFELHIKKLVVGNSELYAALKADYQANEKLGKFVENLQSPTLFKSGEKGGMTSSEIQNKAEEFEKYQKL